MSAPTFKLADLVTEVGDDRQQVVVKVTTAFQDWDDDLQAGDTYDRLEIPRSVEFDAVGLFDVVDDDDERYFRVAVPMPSDTQWREMLLEEVYRRGNGWGAVSLRDVSKLGGFDWSMG
jgi:hypothetical protein